MLQLNLILGHQDQARIGHDENHFLKGFAYILLMLRRLHDVGIVSYHDSQQCEVPRVMQDFRCPPSRRTSCKDTLETEKKKKKKNTDGIIPSLEPWTWSSDKGLGLRFITIA